MTDETKQLIQSTILNYIKRESILEPKELEWEELILEAETSWENELLNEFGLTNLTEVEKRKFLKDYQEEWKNSFLEEEIYFEEDSNPQDEGLLNSIFESKNVTIEVNDFISWMNSQELNSVVPKEKNLKITLNCSPDRFKKKIVYILTKKNIEINDEKSDNISCFICNCFAWDTKKYNNFKIQKTESINFLDRKSLFSLLSYLILLSKTYKTRDSGETYIEYKNFTALADMLRNDLQHINNDDIGLGKHLRSLLSKKLDGTNLLKLTMWAGFNESVKYI